MHVSFRFTVVVAFKIKFFFSEKSWNREHSKVANRRSPAKEIAPEIVGEFADILQLS